MSDAIAVRAQEIIEEVLAMPSADIAITYRLAGVAGLLPHSKILTLTQAGRFGEFCALVSEALIFEACDAKRCV